ncbi:hypothetical protein LJC53_05745 [Bacteroidales bacterium OttesenSCG-928-C03]|nr:hypothetical protein [Bacteroidales bacterium OttesenSCG-928-E04]MDL2309068.1 hypothetical protein [Bacteroidales bacterium OttesenSCG-928-C03]MDL2326822.1 hypothetical protein [Bacteroidales bacterium OttesenSCG-928-A14]
MKRLLSTLFVLAVFFTACKEQNPTNNSFEELSKAQASLINSYKTADSLWHEGTVGATLIDDFVSEAVTFYEAYPEESISPNMLNNAADFCMTLAASYKKATPAVDLSEIAKYAGKAIDLYNLIIKVYPDYEYLNMVYLNRAMIYSDILDDKESADLEFREFLHKFPSDPACEFVSGYLKSDLIGKSSDEIYESFSK